MGCLSAWFGDFHDYSGIHFPTTPLDITVFTNPIISVLPRVLVGLVAGILFTGLYRKTKKVVLASIVAAIFGTLTNTVLVLTLMGTLYTSLVATTYGVDASALFVTLELLQ